MPRLGVQHCLRDFEESIDNALDLLTLADSLRIRLLDGRIIRIGSRRRELYASIALLRIHLAWEDFIENVFIRYMCGAQTASGYSPVLLGAPYPNSRAALSNLLGGSSYLTWSPNNIVTRANVYFDRGDPFVAMVNSARNSLIQINTVRNRFAHRSQFAIVEFETVIRNAIGYMPRGINPGRFLLMADPNNPGLRFVDTYAAILRVSARSIVR